MSNATVGEIGEHPLVRLIVTSDETEAEEDAEAASAWVHEHPEESRSVLLDVASNRTLLQENAPYHGALPISAVYFLGHLEDPSTIGPLFELVFELPRSFPAIMQWDSLWDTLEDTAAVDGAIEQILQVYDRCSEPHHRATVAALLGDIQCTHPRMFDIFIAELPQNPCLMSAYLAELGDKRALPALMELYDSFDWNDGGDFGTRYPGQAVFSISAMRLSRCPASYRRHSGARSRRPGECENRSCLHRRLFRRRTRTKIDCRILSGRDSR